MEKRKSKKQRARRVRRKREDKRTLSQKDVMDILRSTSARHTMDGTWN